MLSDGYVFSSQTDGSTPWRPYRWTSAWLRLRERVGIDKSVRLHDLRHFTATRLLDAGVPVKTVSGRLGHARPATTLNIYAHFAPATDRLAADAMGRILSLGEDPAPAPSRDVPRAPKPGKDGSGDRSSRHTPRSVARRLAGGSPGAGRDADRGSAPRAVSS